MKKVSLMLLALCISFFSFGQTVDQKLTEAVKNNHLAQVKQAIAEGANVNAKDAKNVPVFWWAIFKSDLPLIKYLVSKGASYASQKTLVSCGSGCYYGNMLAIAVGENRLKVVRYLVEKLKVPINDKEWDSSTNCFCGWSPLQWSLNYKHDAITAYLLKQGANLDNLNKSDRLYKASIQALKKFKKQKYLVYNDLQQALENPLKVYYLDLSNAGLEKLPKEIKKLKNLKLLNLSCLPGKENYLYRVLEEDEDVIEVSLVPTDPSKKKLRKLPKEIGQLTNLEQLFCSSNQLTVLPKEIGQLRKLKRLDCSNNQLVTFPKEINQLVNLEWLHCRKNQLSSLPKGIGQLKKLEDLFCTGNPFKSIPPELSDFLKKLKYGYSDEIEKIIKH